MRHTEIIHRTKKKLERHYLLSSSGKRVAMRVKTIFPSSKSKFKPTNGATHEDRKQFFTNFNEALYRELLETKICEQIF